MFADLAHFVVGPLHSVAFAVLPRAQRPGANRSEGNVMPGRPKEHLVDRL